MSLKGIKSKLVTLMLVTVLSMSMGVTAFAGEAYNDYLSGTRTMDEEVIESFLSADENAEIKVSAKELNSVKKLMIGEDGEPVDSYGACSPTAKIQIQTEIKKIADKSTVKNQINTIGDNFNMTADVGNATTALQGFLEPIQTLLGILVVIVTIGMTLFSALDICYITIPVFRNKCEDMKQNGSAATSRTDNATGETKFRWVTDEAIHAVKVCNVDTGKNPLGLYLKKRIWAYMLLGVVLYILFTGNIGIIVNLAVNLVSGLMGTLAELGS